MSSSRLCFRSFFNLFAKIVLLLISSFLFFCQSFFCQFLWLDWAGRIQPQRYGAHRVAAPETRGRSFPFAPFFLTPIFLPSTPVLPKLEPKPALSLLTPAASFMAKRTGMMRRRGSLRLGSHIVLARSVASVLVRAIVPGAVGISSRVLRLRSPRRPGDRVANRNRGEASAGSFLHHLHARALVCHHMLRGGITEIVWLAFHSANHRCLFDDGAVVHDQSTRPDWTAEFGRTDKYEQLRPRMDRDSESRWPERSPSDMAATDSPGHPRWRPHDIRNPYPADG